MDNEESSTPTSLDTILETEALEDLTPPEVELGRSNDGADAPGEGRLDSSSPADVARPQGGCGECNLQGRRLDTGLYCDCELGKRKHLDAMQSVEDRFDTAGVPTRLRGVTLEGYRELAGEEAARQPAVEAVQTLLEGRPATDPTFGTERPGICLLGANGIGKSGLLVILARHVFRAGHVPLWIKYADLVRDGVQAGYGVTYREDVELSTLRLQAAKRVHTLCLDDLGDPFAATRNYDETGDRRDILFRILSARHERGKTTHITANYGGLGELQEQMDPRIADRIKEMCAVYTMRGPNLREEV